MLIFEHFGIQTCSGVAYDGSSILNWSPWTGVQIKLWNWKGWNPWRNVFETADVFIWQAFVIIRLEHLIYGFWVSHCCQDSKRSKSEELGNWYSSSQGFQDYTTCRGWGLYLSYQSFQDNRLGLQSLACWPDPCDYRRMKYVWCDILYRPKLHKYFQEMCMR